MYQIRAAFNNEFYKAGRDRNKLDKVYEFAPQFVIESRRKFDIVSDLKNLLGGLVDETGSNEEKAVLNILTALNKKLKEKSDLKGNNDFLSILIDEKIGSFSIFELLYMKLNDRGGEDNFTKFVKMIYVFWANSSYKNEDLYVDNEETGPNYLAYQNKKILGFYKNGFNFHFLPGYKRPTMFVTRQVKGKHHPKIVGKYHLFQPIQLPEVNQEGSLTLPSTPIPAFYLKAFDDKAAWDNFEKTTWLTLDAVTTLIGFGNLLKFRHLLKLHKANHVIKLKLGLATVEVASGALGTILNFVNECDPGAEKNNNGKKTFCQHLRDFLILLDIATLSVDGIDNLLRTQARKTRDVGYELIEKTKDVEKQREINRITDSLDLFAKPAKDGKLGGKVLKAKQIRKLRGELKKHGGLLILEEDLLNKKIINQFKAININGYKFEKAQDLFYFMKKEGFAGAYDAKTRQMVLGSESTELVAFHEKAHLQHFEELGEVYNSLKTWEKETYVWEQIWSRRRYWTKKELQVSLSYVNRERAKAGIPILKIKL
jgi:hypothetical protein